MLPTADPNLITRLYKGKAWIIHSFNKYLYYSAGSAPGAASTAMNKTLIRLNALVEKTNR